MSHKTHVTPARILIVEDDQVVAISTQSLLRSLGYEVPGIADRGKDAVRLAETTRPDLVLMDIRLRGQLDGIATAKEIQRILNVPIVFVTGFDGDDVRRRAHEVGACGYLTKPYRPEDLQTIISAVLQQQGPV